MDSIIAIFMAALNPLQNLTMRIWAFIPSILAGLILLLVGSFLGRWMRKLVERLLSTMSIDEHSRKIGVGTLLRRLGMGSSLTKVTGFMVYALIFLAFLLAAADVVGLTIVSEFLTKVVGFMPKLIAVVLVLGGGLFLGNFAGKIVYRSATANDVKGADALSKVTYGLMIIFSGLLSLQVLGIDTSILSNSIQIIIGSIGLGCAIAFGVAFGMAGREAAEKWIRDLTPKHESKNGHSRFKKAA